MKKGKRLKEFLKKVISIIKMPEMKILPGHLAFFLVISIIPLIALVGAIALKFGLPTTSIKELMGSFVPHNVIDYFFTAEQNVLSFNVVVFFGAAFILASNGPYAIINTSNEIYKVNNLSMIKKRIKAVLMTFILVSLLIFLIIVPTFGDVLIKIIGTSIKSDSITNILEGIYYLIKYPVSILLIYYNIKLLYTIAPDSDVSSKSVAPGAMFTTIMWVMSSKIFVFYVDYFSNYDLFYGAMSNILVLLLWVYILAYILTLGICLNRAGVMHRPIKEKISDKNEEIESDN